MDRLYAALYRFCHCLGSFLDRHRSSEEPYPWIEDEVLEDEEQRLKYLQIQLTKLRADNTELQSRADDWQKDFSALFSMPLGQLRALASRYEVWGSDGKGWFIAVEHCVFCGCALEIVPFQTERDALLYAALLQTVGYRPKHNLSCSSCYHEYEETHEISIE